MPSSASRSAIRGAPDGACRVIARCRMLTSATLILRPTSGRYGCCRHRVGPTHHRDRRISTAVKLSELLEAFQFVSAGHPDENGAYICRQSGRIYFVSSELGVL